MESEICPSVLCRWTLEEQYLWLANGGIDVRTTGQSDLMAVHLIGSLCVLLVDSLDGCLVWLHQLFGLVGQVVGRLHQGRVPTSGHHLRIVDHWSPGHRFELVHLQPEPVALLHTALVHALEVSFFSILGWIRFDLQLFLNLDHLVEQQLHTIHIQRFQSRFQVRVPALRSRSRRVCVSRASSCLASCSSCPPWSQFYPSTHPIQAWSRLWHRNLLWPSGSSWPNSGTWLVWHRTHWILLDPNLWTLGWGETEEVAVG